VRPSDGIAVALRMEAPILVRASVFDAAGEVLERDEDEKRPIGSPPFDGSHPATRGVSL